MDVLESQPKLDNSYDSIIKAQFGLCTEMCVIFYVRRRRT